MMMMTSSSTHQPSTFERPMNSTTSIDDESKQKHNSASKRKRPFQQYQPQSSWKDLPAFFDAAGAISAPIYAARRLPELQHLWYSTVASSKQHQPSAPSNLATRFSSMEIPHLSGGGKSSSRHLRRRITSYNSYKRHRYPRGGNNGNNIDSSESLMMQQVDQHQRQNNSRRSRRRDRQDLQIRHQGWASVLDSASTATPATPINEEPKEEIQHSNDEGSLAIQSSASLKAETGGQTQVSPGDQLAPRSSTSTCPSSPLPMFWMKTHLWHAKRFHMLDLWNWKVPMIHTNRGTRASLRLVREGHTLLQDVTWRCSEPIVLTFAQDYVNRRSSHVLPLVSFNEFFQTFMPSIELTKSVLRGTQMAEGMLHSANQFPLGAIGPALVWINERESLQKYQSQPHGKQQQHDGNITCTNIDNEDAYGLQRALSVELYVWVHPSIRRNALRSVQDWAQRTSTTATLYNEGDNASQSTTTNASVVAEAPDLGNTRLCDGSPKACFQLRGKSSTKVLAQLKLLSDRDKMILWDWSTLGSCPILHELLPHGSVLFVKFEPQSTNSKNMDIDGGILVEPMGDSIDNQHDQTVTAKEKDYFVSEINRLQKEIETNNNDAFAISNINNSSDENEGHQSHETTKTTTLMIVSQSPRDPNLLQCSGSCGWDIWILDPKFCHDVFMALVLQGKACPIGMLDEAQLRLECDPPLPLFPRDYPDTEEGIKYWQHQQLSTVCNNSEWGLVRKCLENGWGRLSIPRWKKSLGPHSSRGAELQDCDQVANIVDEKKNKARVIPQPCVIDWSDLVAADFISVGEKIEDLGETIKGGQAAESTEATATTSTKSSSVVVMRGAHLGQPLLHALQCCGQLPQRLSTTEATTGPAKRHRRKRRRVKTPHEHTHTVPNTPTQTESLQGMIASLLHGLVLPAVVTCRILVSGRGTLRPGARIFVSENNHFDGTDNDEQGWIGYVTAGSFSPTRGRCHGIGVIGAARFLQSLLHHHKSHSGGGGGLGRAVVQPNGSRQLEVAVRVAPATTSVAGRDPPAPSAVDSHNDDEDDQTRMAAVTGCGAPVQATLALLLE